VYSRGRQPGSEAVSVFAPLYFSIALQKDRYMTLYGLQTKALSVRVFLYLAWSVAYID